MKPHPLFPPLHFVERGIGERYSVMEKYKQKLGKKGEDQAEEYLKNKGFVILDKNYRYGHKEIDLIGKEGNTIVFVEVKTGRSKKFGTPEERVSIRKQKNITMAALDYIQKSDVDGCDFRFDVLAISYEKGKESINHIRNAFMVA
jgi:putative endonuclease